MVGGGTVAAMRIRRLPAFVTLLVTLVVAPIAAGQAPQDTILFDGAGRTRAVPHARHCVSARQESSANLKLPRSTAVVVDHTAEAAAPDGDDGGRLPADAGGAGL